MFQKTASENTGCKGKTSGKKPMGSHRKLVMHEDRAQGRAISSADIISDPTPGWLIKAW